MQFLDVKRIDHEVVQFNGQAHPSATIHGDTLWIWRHLIHKITARAVLLSDRELLAEARRLQNMVNQAFDDYNEVCKRHGLGGFDKPDAETLDDAVSGRGL